MKDSEKGVFASNLKALLDQEFGSCSGWQVNRAGLGALIDCGLSDVQIAAYFAVSPDDIHMLRDEYGLGRETAGSGTLQKMPQVGSWIDG
ncbi:MAG TPA: hypothetical protein VME69_12360 [Methylocella sp.]|nr:hypothetical protein [Methylocella sp.]